MIVEGAKQIKTSRKHSHTQRGEGLGGSRLGPRPSAPPPGCGLCRASCATYPTGNATGISSGADPFKPSIQQCHTKRFFLQTRRARARVTKAAIEGRCGNQARKRRSMREKDQVWWALRDLLGPSWPSPSGRAFAREKIPSWYFLWRLAPRASVLGSAAGLRSMSRIVRDIPHRKCHWHFQWGRPRIRVPQCPRNFVRSLLER